MSSFRNIWAKAIEANQALAMRRADGVAQFDRLFFEYPNDGMVHYERGEAFEYLGDLPRAADDYQKAEQHLPLAHWKDVARIALARVQGKISGNSDYKAASPQWQAFHAVHRVPQALHKLRCDALFAIQRIDSEPGASATSLRRCAENIERSASELGRPIPDTLRHLFGRIKTFGNRGAHTYAHIHQIDVNGVLDAFVQVITWAGSEVWSEQRLNQPARVARR